MTDSPQATEKHPPQSAAGQSDPPRPTTDLAPKVEAALLASERPISVARLADALGGIAAAQIKTAVAHLNQTYERDGRSFRIESVAGGWQIRTLPEHAAVLTALHKTRSQSKLSPAALETLAIVAYKQPIMRAEIETIRGVACGEVLRSLMDRHLIKIVGRAEEIGRPMLYGTTKAFLEVFGLSNLKDLPKVEDLTKTSER